MASGRPTKEEQIAIQKRNEEIIKMSQETYSVEYLANYFGLSAARISRIIKKGRTTLLTPKS